MVLRLTEVYLSSQGEGPNVGDPTCFVRFAGCNLRCPLWPCDTPFAIYPKEYRHLWNPYTAGELGAEIRRVTENDTNIRICFTGGEPWLQPEDELHDVVDQLKLSGYRKFEMFSNGTLEYDGWRRYQIPVIMDWKLPGSGEDPFNEVRIEKNLKQLTPEDAIKFVISDREDFILAIDLWNRYILEHTDAQVFYGAAWNKIETKTIVAWALEEHLPWRLNVQVHNLIWSPTERGR